MGQRRFKISSSRAFTGKALLEFLYGFHQTLRLHGFEQVVHSLRLKGLHGVLVIGGHKHQCRERLGARCGGVPGVGQRGGRVQTAQTGHAYIKKQHVGPQRQGLRQGAVPVAHAGEHLQVRPKAG